MTSLRHVLPVIFALVAGHAAAQAVHAKHLVTSMGGGIGLTTLDSSNDSLDQDITGSGVVRFAFGYAISDRWSLGVHYDRIGSDDLAPGSRYVRFTTYTLEGTYRPLIGAKGALELNAAVGATTMALTAEDARLPIRMSTGVATFGLRYLRMFRGVVGGFVGVEHSASGAGMLTFNDRTLENAQGGTYTASWTAQRVTAGLVVRF